MSRLIIVAGLYLLVFGPVLRHYIFEHSIPRWYLAYGANQLDHQKNASARKWLDRALELDPSIAGDPHYIVARFQLLMEEEGTEREDIQAFVDQFIEANRTLKKGGQSAKLNEREALEAERLNRLVEAISADLLTKRYPVEAVQLMQEMYPPLEHRTPMQNNSLAYARSLAGTDLDIALLEIDKALSHSSFRDSFEFLDTKAWVLHRRGENSTALEYADRSIDRRYEELANSKITVISKILIPDETIVNLWGEDGSFDLANEKAAIRASLDELDADLASGIKSLLHQVAVLRFHRLKILEALHRHEAGGADRLWLELFEFTDEGQLF